jgi:site-specific recombinase XerD
MIHLARAADRADVRVLIRTAFYTGMGELMRVHELRRSAASEMITADVDLFTVGAVLGHKDPRSTKRYSHLTHNTPAAAVGKIGRKSPHKPQEKDRPKAA